MVCNTQNYWVSGLWPSSGFLETRKHSVSEFPKRCVFYFLDCWTDRTCGLAVRVPAYRSRDPGFDSRHYQFFWEVDLERGPLILLSITEELLEWKSSVSGSRKSRLTAVGIRCVDTLYPLKLAPISPICGGRSVGIVCSRSKTMEFRFIF
jgi:hypothetical protein